MFINKYFSSSKYNTVEIELSGDIPEETVDSPVPFTSNEILTVLEVNKIFRYLCASKIKAVVLNLKDINIGFARANEIRTYISDLILSGKRVYVYLESPNNIEYFIASAASHIVIPPWSTFNFIGLVTEAYFIKDLLNDFGIEPEIKGIGEYKSSAEMFTRNSMSKYNKEMLSDIINEQFSVLVELVSKSRNIKSIDLQSFIDMAPLDPQKALELGLVDAIGYLSGIEHRISEDLNEKVNKVSLKKFLRNRKIKQFVLKTKDRFFRKGKSIGIVNINGLITQGKSRYGKTAGSETIIESIDKALEDSSISALLVRVNSPGGSALASDLIRNKIEVASEKKPVFISMSDLSASGGYMVSLGGKRIFADRFTLTGSIGVVSGKFNISNLLNKVGITNQFLSKGKMATIYSMNKGFNQQEERHFNNMIKGMYSSFVKLVSNSRSITLQKTEDVSKGRVWTGNMAKDRDLIDDLGSYNTALKYACNECGIPFNENLSIKVFKIKQKFNLSTITGFGSIIDKKEEVSELIKLAQERILLVLDFILKFR